VVSVHATRTLAQARRPRPEIGGTPGRIGAGYLDVDLMHGDRRLGLDMPHKRT
jgi:hypothetical protein